ncbi:MAG TPA: DUF1592 domain-containing protein [Polyangia bacterium]|nr:DUF1592 domain-containing protein [Polyangia bacterium]
MGPLTRLRCAAAAASLAFVVAGCGSRKLQDKGPGQIVSGGAGIGGGGPSGAAGAGNSAGGGQLPDPCDGSDPELVLAPQRKLLLTSNELVNMVSILVNDVEVGAIVNEAIINVVTDYQRRFPPGLFEPTKQIANSTEMIPFTNLARHVAKYVFDNFQQATGCVPATDACAKAYLATFAEKAYRRPLDAGEQSDLDASYEAARAAGAIEEATRDVIATILVAPPFLYRSEMGDPARPSLSPPGMPLTPYELASALSFFLTDGPPDQLLLDDARAGTLPATLAAHTDRLLTTPAARAWLTKLIETLYKLNELPGVIIDRNKVPIAGDALYADLQEEARLFLDDTLWNANLTDILLSRTTFLNSNLAKYIYDLPAPTGATGSNFVRTTLPADQRSGLLTNAGFITLTARAERTSLVHRGITVGALMLCRGFPPPPSTAVSGETVQLNALDTQTGQQQVVYRASMPPCGSCHAQFDPYGLALDGYDMVGRFRDTDDLGEPINASATLPPELGGGTVANAVDLARVIAMSPAFTNCMTSNMLRYALVDAPVDLPSPPDGKRGCAVADVVRRFAGGAATFPALMRAVALSPAFAMRVPAQ